MILEFDFRTFENTSVKNKIKPTLTVDQALLRILCFICSILFVEEENGQKADTKEEEEQNSHILKTK